MYFKTLRVQLKDLFVEMREEKQKLLKEIELLKDFRNCLNSFVNCCKCDQNVKNGNKFIANQLESQYLTSLSSDLVIEKSNVDLFGDKLVKGEPINRLVDINTKDDNPIDSFVEDEVIINENILEIDCSQMSDDFPINEIIDCRGSDNSFIKEIQLEVIPKKETQEEEQKVFDLEVEEPTIEQKYKDLELILNNNKSICETEELNSMSLSTDCGTDPKMCENRFSYLTSFMSQTPNSDKMNSIANFSANNDNNNSGKTIVVEKNKKIIGFVCNNNNNCNQFYKSIIGLQSHIDRIHNKSQTVAKESNYNKNSAKKSNSLPKLTSIKSLNIQRESESEKELSIDGKERPKINRIKNNTKYKCEETNCGYSCGTKYQLLSHKVSKHKNGRHFRCKRPDCQLMFKSKFDVIQHLRMHSIKSTKHPKEGVLTGLESLFKCRFKDCYLCFNTRSQLEKHKIESNHLLDTVHQFKCLFEKCERTFKSQFALNVHRRFKHQIRSKITKTANTSKKVDKNASKFKFKCSLDNCNLSFKSRFALNQHIKKFNHKSMILFTPSKNIFYSVSNEGTRQFKCPKIDCKEVFKHRFALNQHLKSCKNLENGMTVNPFSCEILGCDQQFPYYVTLKKHIKTFHKLPPLKCRLKECSSRFFSRSEKIEHFKKCHSSL